MAFELNGGLFACLEALAYKLISGETGSRTAVRKMLRLDRDYSQCSVSGKTYTYEPIELAGRLRAKMFHGVRFRREELNEPGKDGYDLLQAAPQIVVDARVLFRRFAPSPTDWYQGTWKG